MAATPLPSHAVDICTHACAPCAPYARVHAHPLTRLRMRTPTPQEAGVWEPLVYVPAKSSMGLLKQITERVYREKLTQEGFASGSQRMQAVKHAVAVADGEEPPPLSAAADVPPVPVS